MRVLTSPGALFHSKDNCEWCNMHFTGFGQIAQSRLGHLGSVPLQPRSRSSESPDHMDIRALSLSSHSVVMTSLGMHVRQCETS